MSSMTANLQKKIMMPTAYEWHNYKTGHCYVDYIPREGMGEKDGYNKIPLFKYDDIRLLFAIYDKYDNTIIAVHKTEEGALKNMNNMNVMGLINNDMEIDYCIVHP